MPLLLYGRYANSTRGRLRKREHVDPIPTVLEAPISSEAFRRNGARLIQKVFEVDPLVCSHCQGRLRVVSFIEDALVIRMPAAIRFATKVSAIEEPLL